MPRLTKREVDKAEPKAQRYTVFDDELKGFGLRVFPSGAKSWVVEYRPEGGGRRTAKRRLTLGSAMTLTPDEARRTARTELARVRLGKDPARDKIELRNAPTLADVARAFLDEHARAKRKPRTAAHYSDIIDRIVLPELGTVRAEAITRSDIARLHLKWKHTHVQANRMLGIVSGIYGFACRRGLVPEGTNPAHRIEKFPESRRERFLSVDELMRIGAAIRAAETIGVAWDIDTTRPTAKHTPRNNRRTIIGPHAAAALRLLIFTGARLREILHLRWEQVDFDRGLLLLPDSKTGRKTIILNAPALAILSELPCVGAYVIAGESSDAPRADLKRPWQVVVRHAGLKGVRLHDLRHTYASIGAGSGLGLPIIGKLLGHADSRTTERYAHLDNDPLRKATNTIGSSLAAALLPPRDDKQEVENVITDKRIGLAR
ncbi:MAG: site-specific integrase [Hyphomicrobiaceae bacterium]